MGGVAILVRARIKQQVIPNLNLLSLEAVAVLIKLNNRYVTIVSAYQPPSRQMQMSDYDKVMNLDNSIIMAGDLNAKHTNWGCRVINPNGTKLLSFIANTPYTNYAPNEPTYFPSDVNRQPDILDILLIKSFPLICTQEALAELDSDHIPVHKLLDLPDYSVQNCMDYVTPNEVKLIVKNLPNKKAPGHDHLTNLMFKKLPAKGIVLMTSLFNFLLRVGHFPLSWKIATIILIKKPGKNKSNPDSYRPISLLTSLSKIFEKVIHTRLLNYLNSAEVIPKFQFGFRPNHSTIQQLFRITEHISNSFEKHCHTGAVFIDVSKAFDKFSSRSQSSRHFKKKKNTRTSSDALTPPYTSKNRFSPLLTIQVDDNTDGIANEVSTQQSQVRPKIPPIYVYNISDYENFHTSLANITFDEFSIANTKSALKVNMDSIDDYRTATKLFDDSGTEYHTYQFPENKQLSVIIRNLPVNMSEACIYKELVELKFEVASVTRLQNKFKTPIPIVAILNTLLAFLTHHNIDIACITETHLSSLDEIKFPGYIPHRTDRVTQSRAMGGVAILVRARIKQQVIPNLNLLSLEAVAVLIKLNNRYVTIVSAYQPPSRQMQMSDYDKVMNLDNSIIMAGDLNAKHTNWGCRVINPNGTKLLSFIANTPYTNYAPNEPTYFPSDVNRQPDILDILLIKSFPLICTQEALAELDSDHIPVKITINSSSQSYQSNNSLIKGKPNWDIFSNQINTNLIIPKTIPTIQAAEQMSEHLTTVIADAARACSKPTLHNTKNIGFLPQYILSLIQRKHHARRIWQNQRNTENKKILNKLTKDVRTALQNYRVSSYNSYLLNMYPGDSNLWKETKRLLNQEINIILPLRTANELVISDADKCSVFSEMLYNIFSTNQISDINNERQVHKLLDLPDYSVQNCMDYVTPNEVKLIVKNLPNKKPPGHDHLTNLMFKKLPAKGIVLMTSLFNFLELHTQKNYLKNIIPDQFPNFYHNLIDSRNSVIPVDTVKIIKEHFKKKKNTRTSSDALTPPYTSKNRFSPLLTIQVDDNTDGIANEVSTQQSQVRPKIPPIYVYNISDYENFHTSLANITFDEFSIANTKSALKVNMDSIDDYRTATKLFDDSGTEYHTYQFPENKQLSVIIRNLPVNMSEACIYKELVELKFEVASVTRLQNKFKTPIPIVAILLSKSSTEIYSLNRLLHCVVTVEPRQPSKGIPQCTNCQRFSHTKKFCHLPPRCVKCAGDHHYSSCPKEIETPPKCVNCLSDHPATYRGCTFYKEISKDKKNATQFKNNYTKVQFPVNISNITQNDVTDKRSYAAATKNKSQDKSFNNTDNDFMKTLNTLLAFLTHHNIDIACITETHLSSLDEIKFPGYIPHRTDRVTQSRAMGGVAILVRARIKQQVIPNLNLLSLEAVAVLIKLNNRYVTIVSAYQPPSRQMQMSDYDKVMNLDNSIIMAGDLNAKHTNWGCRVINPNGTKLLSFIANTPYTNYAPNEPTYFPSDVNRQPDILDILLIKSFPLICTQEALAELDSDHIPVKITINSSSQSYQSNNSLIKGKPNWDIFSNQINTNLIIPKTIPTIQAAEQMSEHLTTVIADAARACSKPTLHNTKNIGFLPQYILSLIQRKHHARRIWQNQRNTENKKILNKLTKDVRTALQNYRVSSYNSYLLNMYPGDSNLWKETKRLLNQEINIILPLRTANELVISDADKCSFSSRSQSSRHFKKKKNTRTSSDALTPPYTSKNRFSPLLTIQVDDNTDGIANEVSTQQSQVRPKIPPIYVYNISDYENFHTSLANITFDEFSIANTKSALKVNMDSIDDYRTATKLFDDSGTEYHTYQFPENKQLSVIIRNLPVNMSEACIYKELLELKFEVASVTRLQNKFKTPIPIVAILLSKSSTEIYSLNRLLHCVVTVEPRQPSKGIPQCTNCQRFSHTKKFCHLPPRCVKCAGDHHYSSCPKEIETPPKCVNCLSDHPATYRGCTFYKEISKDKKNATQFKNNYTKVQFPVNISNITQNDVTDKRSYAAATKNKSQDKSFNNTDNDFMKTLLPLINTFISQLLQKIIENLPAILNSVHLNPNGSP
ncbi:hypothetical protein QTP88_006335 [Uroleucon formosanum]